MSDGRSRGIKNVLKRGDRRLRWLVLSLIVSLGLFFGLFFGLDYSEILRRGWPLAKCTVTSSDVQSRYCCYRQCFSSCSIPALGVPSCSSLVNQLNGGYNPTDCQRNSSACPENRSGGLTCDDGYYCCQNCCNTCQRCSQSCTGSGSSRSCSSSCTSYQCNCYCCSATQHRSCTVQCPTCYNAVLGLSYTPTGGARRNVTYSQDFSQNQGGAESFASSNAVGTSHKCYYNKKNLNEVTLDVTFTPWKWVVSAIFGMVPLLAVILFASFIYCGRPIVNKARAILGQHYQSTGKARAEESIDSTDAEIRKVDDNMNGVAGRGGKEENM
ncbi:hypothetical protein E1B28_011509 [Marasmius oreades]|uniref:TNFR-Cys domain-containing protein n=1 Tax=Marasmius oreades TaxID=181124 RepID=A0A9P7UR95_9AGAR|nr:uncharacterized protein E1B28_011509 [Marasmius oreades]KAG7089866.1 hypothetical protein E1B28_011509 [Marasmius oreades]